MTVNIELLSSPWIHIDQQLQWDNTAIGSQVKYYKSKEIIIRAGTLLNCLYYLKEGRLKTTAISPSGHQKIMWYLETGCFFGETAFFNQKPCDYDFIAVTDCEVLRFPSEVVFQEIIPKNPSLTLSLITMLTRKVHILSTQVEDFTFNKPVARVAKLVYLLYQENHRLTKKNTASIPLKQDDIAELLGLHRVTVNQALRHLKDSKALEDDSHIIVKDPAKLKEIFADNTA